MLLVFLSLLLAQKADDPIWYELVQSRTTRTDSALVRAFSGDVDQFSDTALKQFILSLGQNGNPEQASRLLVFMRDSKTQADAILAYGEIDGAPLAPLLAAKDDVRSQNSRYFVQALAKLAGSDDAARLTTAWQDFSRNMKNEALFYFWRHKTPALTRAVLERLDRNTGSNTDGYVYYLYRAQIEVEPKLLAKILEGYRSNAQTLIYALRIKGAEPSDQVTTLLGAYTNNSDWRVRVNALNALNAADKESALERAERLLDDPNPNVQKTAVNVLVRMRSAEADRLVLKEGKKMSPGLRAAVMRAADKDQARKFFPLVADWSGASDSWRAMRYLTFQGYSGDPSAKDALLELARKGYSVQAVLAMATLNDQGALDRKLAEEALNSGDVFKMSAALGTLRDNKDRSTWPISFEALQALAAKTYREPDFHQAYVRNLATMVDQGVYAGELARLRQHPDYLVRLTALGATPDVTPEMRKAVLGIGRQSEMPPAVTAVAAQMMSGNLSRDWILHTSKGKITVELASVDAPITCANIVYLSGRGYFQNLPLHRVVPNFVVQAGDSRGDGAGGPGYSIPCEINRLPFEQASVGMALSGKDTGGSQFFICHSDQPHLDGGYTVFGKVTRGMRVVDKLEEGDVILKTEIK
ncbi:MAG: peptidylprolyl isomerase [Acidobacteriota bacterium]|nr:peptidylprolyl isomerase [Acidobacteriota bacterium]